MEDLTAVYDLSRSPPTYDFLAFLIQAEMTRRSGGFDRLFIEIKPGPADGFRKDNLPPCLSERRKMLDRVVRGVLPLMGAQEGNSGQVVKHLRYGEKPILAAGWAGQEVPFFHATEGAKEKVKEYEGCVVLSLREAVYWPARNADLPAWLALADELKRRGHRPVFVRDTAQASVPLEGYETVPLASEDIDVRLALYEAAQWTMAVNGGPCMLLWHSECPYAVFKQLVSNSGVTTSAHWTNGFGLPPGQQFPWAGEKQIMTWKPDSLGEMLEVLDVFDG